MDLCPNAESVLEARLLRTLQGDSHSKLTSCLIVPGRQQVATSSEDGSLLLWPLAPGRPRPMRLSRKGGPVTSLVSSLSGDVLAAASSDGTVTLWQNRAGKQEPAVIKVHFSPVRACDISFDEQLILSASDDKSVKLCSLPSRRFVASLTGHTNWVRSAVFSRTGEQIASGSDDKTVMLWDTERRSAVKVWHDCGASITCVRFGPGEGIIAASTWDSSINLWDARSHALRQHYGRAHSSPITQIAFHPVEEVLLTSSMDKTLRLWDLRAGRLRSTVSGHEQSVLGCCWDAQGKMFASCDSRLVHLWGCPVSLAAPTAGTAETQVRLPAQVRPVAQLPPRAEATLTGDFRPAERQCLAPQHPQRNQEASAASAAEAQPAEPHSAPSYSGKASQVSSGVAMSEAVARTVEQIVSQMGLLTRSLEGLEARMARLEAQAAESARLVSSGTH